MAIDKEIRGSEETVMTPEEQKKWADKMVGKKTIETKSDVKEPKKPFVLDDAAKKKIEIEVEIQLEAEAQAKAEADYKAKLIQEAKRQLLFSQAEKGTAGEGKHPIFIDLPPSSQNIRLDGKQYDVNRTYHVTKEVHASLTDVMGAGRRHEESLMDKQGKLNAYRKRLNQHATL